jgi:hypothetical protein
MRFLWTLVKFVLLLAIGIPLAIIVLSVSLGILGAVVGLAFFALRIALVCLLVYGAFRLGMALLGRKSAPKPVRPAEIPRPVDPYYEAARRELDLEIPEAR